MHLLRLGLLLGVATFCHGFEHGCRRAEALAINDNGMIHPIQSKSKILVFL